MRIRLITRHLPRAGDLDELVQRRAGYAFARFSDLVRHVDVRVQDDNGPRGGGGIGCLAVARLGDGGRVLVEGRALTPEAGISDCLQRLANALRRQLDRRHDHR